MSPIAVARQGCCGLMVAALGVSLPGAALAGPWGQETGQGQVVTQISPYTSEVRGTDDRGRATGTGRLYRGDIGAYWEHGVSPRWTVGLAPRLQASWLDDRVNHSSYASQGLSEVAGFLRYNLYKGRLDSLSVQATGYSPGIANQSRTLRVGETHAGIGGSISYGIGIPLPRGMAAFAAIEAGYRFRPGSAGDDIKLDGTIGFRPIPRWMVLAQSFTTIGARNNGPGGADYSINKLQFSVVHDLTERHSIQLGYMREISGRNVSLGQAVLGSFWYRY